MNQIKEIISFFDPGKDLKDEQNINLLLDTSQEQNTTISLPIQNDISSNKNSDKDINHTDKTKIDNTISIFHLVKDPKGIEDVSSLVYISHDQNSKNPLSQVSNLIPKINPYKYMQDTDAYYYSFFDYGEFTNQNLNISLKHISKIIEYFSKGDKQKN